MSEAAKAEAEGVETVEVRWRTLAPFEIPRYRADWPFDTVLAAEQELWPTMLSTLLPASALAGFRDMRPTQRDAMNLLSEIADALGFDDPGESSASTS